MLYKVGDIVIPIKNNEHGFYYMINGLGKKENIFDSYTDEMVKRYAGKPIRIISCDYKYKAEMLNGSKIRFSWTDEMFEGKAGSFCLGSLI